MHRTTHIITICLLVLLPSLLLSQQALSLSDALRIGLHNSFQIKIANLKKDISSNNEKGGTSFHLPSVDFRLKQGNNVSFDSSPTSFVDGSYSETDISANVDASWVLFDGHQARLNKFQLEQLSKQSNGLSQLVVENTIHAIILAYYKALIEQKKMEVIKEVQQLSAEKLDWAKNMKRNGSMSDFELLNYENALLSDSINLQYQRVTTERAKNQLRTTMGVQKKASYRLVSPLNFDEKDFSYKRLVKKLVSSNQDLKNQLINLTLRDNQLKRERSSRKPTLLARSGLSHEFSTSKFKSEERSSGAVFDFYINFSLSYRLYDGGEAKRQIQSAELEKRIASLEIDELKQQLKEELRIACYNYATQCQIIKTQEKLVSNLRKGLLIGKDRLENGYSNFLDYRSLQLDFLRSQLDALEAIFEIKGTETEITRLTGGLTRRSK